MDFSVLVMSSDSYSDLWDPFAECFRRYWPDCSAPVYLVTELKESRNNLFAKTITCGKDTLWTDRLGVALAEIKTEYLILMCEDYLLCDLVDTVQLKTYLDYARKYELGNLRLVPNPKSTVLFDLNQDLKVLEKGIPYRVSMQVGIWRTDYLGNFVNLSCNIRGFERLGSSKSDDFESPILTTKENFFPFIDAIHKGKWEGIGQSLCSRLGIPVDLDYRPLMTNLDYLRKHGKGAVMDYAPQLTSNFMIVVSRLKRLISKLT